MKLDRGSEGRVIRVSRDERVLRLVDGGAVEQLTRGAALLGLRTRTTAARERGQSHI